jgi:cytochrome-b5 reductase
MSLMDGDAFDLKRDYIYVPAVLLIMGTFIVKREWTIYAAVVSIVLGAYNLWNLRE